MRERDYLGNHTFMTSTKNDQSYDLTYLQNWAIILLFIINRTCKQVTNFNQFSGQAFRRSSSHNKIVWLNCLSNPKMVVYLIECRVYGEQYTGSTVTKSSMRANNHKLQTGKKLQKKKEKSCKTKSELKSTFMRFIYWMDQNGTDNWEIVLVDQVETWRFKDKCSYIGITNLKLMILLA